MRHTPPVKNGLRGVTLIEMLVYTGVLAMLVSSIIYTLIMLGSVYRSIKSNSAIQSAAHVALERMTREIRSAASIDTSQSTLGSSPGTLALVTTDDSGATTTIKFFMSSTTPHIMKAGVDTGPLAASTTRVTNLVFRQITTPHSQGVKIEMKAESGSGKNYRAEWFYSTVILRGSYPL